MNLKTIIAKVVSWFKGEAETVEQDVDKGVQWIATGAGIVRASTVNEVIMSTPAAAPATTASNVNAAIQIALALKAIDASLSVDAVQAATNAALAALYPAA